MTIPIDSEHWLKIVANLRVDRKHNIAPHKPLLLLVVAELVEQGKLLEPLLLLKGELVFRFLVFWTVVSSRRSQRPEITLPFYHLQSDGFWESLDETGRPSAGRRQASGAKLDEGFFTCLKNPQFREKMRRVLIARYFTDGRERAALYSLVGLSVPPDDIVRADALLFSAASECGREARFRLTIVPAYNYTCALTGYRLITVRSGCIVDAAHIHQFSDSQNNDPRNGIALCKNAHWLFDQGLWSLTDGYEVVVAVGRFDEIGPDAFLLEQFAGRKIGLPANCNYWPDKKHLAWHRKHKFQGF